MLPDDLLSQRGRPMIDDRLSLPQLEHRPFLTDSGLETKLIFIDGIELPEFARVRPARDL
jgi:hypothetical protein